MVGLAVGRVRFQLEVAVAAWAPVAENVGAFLLVVYRVA
jgi:hypothetical protein